MRGSRFIANILMYTGVVSLVVFWPITTIILFNDSFRIIGHWSSSVFALCVILYLIMPIVFLVVVDYLMFHWSQSGSLFFQGIIFVISAEVLWMQFIYYHFNRWMGGQAWMSEALRYHSIWVGALIIALFVIKVRRLFPIFYTVLSPVFLIAMAFLFFQTVHRTSFNDRTSQAVSASLLQYPSVYLLIFDAVSLERLLNGSEIDKNRFPTFYQISQEWTWYRNATSNGASTIPARSIIFSGEYYKEQDSLRPPSDGLLRVLGVHGIEIHPHFTRLAALSSDTDFSSLSAVSASSLGESIQFNKALLIAYLELSSPSPLRHALQSTALWNWKFDWRGSIPSEYRSEPHAYYGEKYKKHYEDFLKDATMPRLSNSHFYVLWSMISHYPYIFDERGRIRKPTYSDFNEAKGSRTLALMEEDYRQTLQYVDSLVGEFVHRLKEKGLYNDAVIMLLSDHGISSTGSNYDISDQVARIPFFVKAPGLEPGVNNRDVQSVDVTPTLLDSLGLPLSSRYKGQSLLRPYQSRQKVIYALGKSGVWILQPDGRWMNQ
ncbi:MAG: sulfatase-like hydrolase/transferase [Candidatus Manganitrophus sp. SA1]|nr:sulfatase-like hydrolase/transferase [Candidatus Manganitrophus morganii]